MPMTSRHDHRNHKMNTVARQTFLCTSQQLLNYPQRPIFGKTQIWRIYHADKLTLECHVPPPWYCTLQAENRRTIRYHSERHFDTPMQCTSQH